MVKRKRRRKHVQRYIDNVPIYKKVDVNTGQEVQVAYFDVWCREQIGASWSEQYNFMLDTMRASIMEIEEYWKDLRGDFYRWCRNNGIKGWKVYLYSERM